MPPNLITLKKSQNSSLKIASSHKCLLNMNSHLCSEWDNRQLFCTHLIIEFSPTNLISVNQGMQFIATTITATTTTAQGKLFHIAFNTFRSEDTRGEDI